MGVILASAIVVRKMSTTQLENVFLQFTDANQCHFPKLKVSIPVIKTLLLLPEHLLEIKISPKMAILNFMQIVHE